MRVKREVSKHSKRSGEWAPTPARAPRPASDPARERLLAALDDAGAQARLAVEGHDVGVTHLDRIYWPADAATGTHALTKRDFLRYLVRVAPVMLPHLADRPLTIFRWPEGITGRRVLEKPGSRRSTSATFTSATSRPRSRARTTLGQGGFHARPASRMHSPRPRVRTGPDHHADRRWVSAFDEFST